MKAAQTVRLVAALALAAAVPACARQCVPESLADPRRLVDLCAPPDGHAPVDPGIVREVADEFRRRTAGAHPPGTPPYHVLALSGGGLYGAFGVGVLCGWTDAGTRPEFDVVTGISTGALVSTFAFLGPQYDEYLRDNIVGVERFDFLKLRSFVALPFAPSAFTSRPLARRIEQALTPRVLCEVARAYAAGRRLYVGTTALDQGRLVIWDMGAIAARGTPQAYDLYRTVVLASASVPAAFPPVRLPVEIDGREYEELHVDGGASDSVIFRSFMVADRNRAAGRQTPFAPAGSTLHVVTNGKLYIDPSCVRTKVLPIAAASTWSLLYNKTRDEMYRIYMNCLETGVDFRLAAVPREMPVASTSLRLSGEDQWKLYRAGYQFGLGAATGDGWRDLPPGANPGEQALPRAGTRFATGGGEACAPTAGRE
jgi:predicted patatin/cPLA2 family phospholipase